MAFRLKFSTRALRETGEAQEWYELQSPGLGKEFITAMELQLKRLEQAPDQRRLRPNCCLSGMVFNQLQQVVLCNQFSITVV